MAGLPVCPVWCLAALPPPMLLYGEGHRHDPVLHTPSGSPLSEDDKWPSLLSGLASSAQTLGTAPGATVVRF